MSETYQIPDGAEWEIAYKKVAQAMGIICSPLSLAAIERIAQHNYESAIWTIPPYTLLRKVMLHTFEAQGKPVLYLGDFRTIYLRPDVVEQIDTQIFAGIRKTFFYYPPSFDKEVVRETDVALIFGRGKLSSNTPESVFVVGQDMIPRDETPARKLLRSRGIHTLGDEEEANWIRAMDNFERMPGVMQYDTGLKQLMESFTL